MNDIPTVAAIVPTFNRKDKLTRFLHTISKQTYPNLQIIVVDSSSSDGTAESIAIQFPEVTLISVSDRHFWTGATNVGIKIAIERQVDFILTINDDALVSNDHISRLINLVQKHQLLILGSRIDYLEPCCKIWSLGTYSDWATDRFLQIAYNDVDVADIDPRILQQELLAVDTLPGNGVLIKTEVFSRIGLYNEIFCPHYHGDSELILRAKQFGIQAWITPQVILLNDFSNSQKKLPPKNMTGIKYIFFNPKSHLFMLPILYIVWRYCPRSQWLPTILKLIQRFQRMSAK